MDVKQLSSKIKNKNLSFFKFSTYKTHYSQPACVELVQMEANQKAQTHEPQ